MLRVGGTSIFDNLVLHAANTQKKVNKKPVHIYQVMKLQFGKNGRDPNIT
jgi:hypothetical protein